MLLQTRGRALEAAVAIASPAADYGHAWVQVLAAPVARPRVRQDVHLQTVLAATVEPTGLVPKRWEMSSVAVSARVAVAAPVASDKRSMDPTVLSGHTVGADGIKHLSPENGVQEFEPASGTRTKIVSERSAWRGVPKTRAETRRIRVPGKGAGERHEHCQKHPPLATDQCTRDEEGGSSPARSA